MNGDTEIQCWRSLEHWDENTKELTISLVLFVTKE